MRFHCNVPKSLAMLEGIHHDPLEELVPGDPKPWLLLTDIIMSQLINLATGMAQGTASPAERPEVKGGGNFIV